MKFGAWDVIYLFVFVDSFFFCCFFEMNVRGYWFFLPFFWTLTRSLDSTIVKCFFPHFCKILQVELSQWKWKEKTNFWYEYFPYWCSFHPLQVMSFDWNIYEGFSVGDVKTFISNAISWQRDVIIVAEKPFPLQRTSCFIKFLSSSSSSRHLTELWSLTTAFKFVPRKTEENQEAWNLEAFSSAPSFNHSIGFREGGDCGVQRFIEKISNFQYWNFPEQFQTSRRLMLVSHQQRKHHHWNKHLTQETEIIKIIWIFYSRVVWLGWVGKWDGESAAKKKIHPKMVEF